MQTPESQFNEFNSPEYLTAEGIEELKKELDERKQRRLEIIKRIEYAREQGDLTENSEYDTAKNEQGENESSILEIEDILSRAEIISKNEENGDIQLGSFVSLQKDGSDKIEKYSLIGAEEANPLKGKISNESPLGSAIIGRRKGENITVITPKGKINYTIIDVG